MSIKQEKYNGWSNRSTWLVMLHLDNTSKEVYEEARKIVKDNSFAIAGLITLLKEKTQINSEQYFDNDEVNWTEIKKALS